MESNGKPSSSEPTGQDWDKVVRICVENREADVASFLQRHFTSQQIKDFIAFHTQPVAETLKTPDKVNECLENGSVYYHELTNKMDLPFHGSFQVAFKIDDASLKIDLTEATLNRFKSCNPRFTGSPSWIILNNSPNIDKHPKRKADRYESFIIGSSESNPTSIDYWYFTKDGEFYLYRALKDDINGAANPIANAARRTMFDPIYAILTITEAIATGLSFANELKCAEDITLNFSFKWTNLKNRILYSWAHPDLMEPIDQRYKADEEIIVINNIKAPVGISYAGIGQHVYEIVKELFSYFGGYSQISRETILKIVSSFLHREG